MTDSGSDPKREIEIEVDDGSGDARTVGPDAAGDGGTDPGERSLGDELGRIDVLTTPEGYVEGRVTDLTSLDATTVRLEAALPHDETVSFALEKPIPWSREFLLARIVEDVGYDAASIDHLVGEPIYLARTDAGPAADGDSSDWRTSLVRTAGDAALAALGAGFRLEDDREPEWRLVDPLERPDAAGDDAESRGTAAAGLVLLGVLVAAAGAVVGATGGLAVSPAVVGYSLPGVALALLGVYAIVTDDRT